MDSSEGDFEVSFPVQSEPAAVVRVCPCMWPSTHPVALVPLPSPQAFESPSSSPSLPFRTHYHRRQNSDTHTLSDMVRSTHIYSHSLLLIGFFCVNRCFALQGGRWLLMQGMSSCTQVVRFRLCLMHFDSLGLLKQ